MNFNIPSRDIKWAARCKSLELKEELRARNRNVRLINIWMVYKAMGMNGEHLRVECRQRRDPRSEPWVLQNVKVRKIRKKIMTVVLEKLNEYCFNEGVINYVKYC